MRWWERAEHALVVTLCTHEPVAIFSGGRLPTITRLSCRWPILGQAIVWGLCWHFAAAVDPLNPAPTEEI